MEVLKIDGTHMCHLPPLPDVRFGHTQSGLVACGGEMNSVSKSCVTFNNGTWNKSHNLSHRRYLHSSWFSVHHGTFLLGGSSYAVSTEKLTVNGSNKSFELEDSTV